MGKLNVVKKRELHVHEPLPNIEDDWGPGTTFECMCGGEWKLEFGLKDNPFWQPVAKPRKIGDDGLPARHSTFR